MTAGHSQSRGVTSGLPVLYHDGWSWHHCHLDTPTDSLKGSKLPTHKRHPVCPIVLRIGATEIKIIDGLGELTLMADLKSLSTFKFTDLQADDRVKAIQMAWNGYEQLAKLLILVPSQNSIDLGTDSTNALLRYGIKHHR